MSTAASNRSIARLRKANSAVHTPGSPAQLPRLPSGFVEKTPVYARQLRAELAGYRGQSSLTKTLSAQEQLVFLSPHRDDICFSLGALALRLGHGLLLNLFTASQHIVDRPRGERPSADVVTRLRCEEDRRFAELSGLRVVDLGLEEPPMKGRTPFDQSGITDDRAALTGPLLECLITFEPAGDSDAPSVLFCPAAIGGHANHLAAMLTVIDALPTIERRFRVLFYEDLPYASSGSKRRAGLTRLFSLVEGRHPIRHAIPLGVDAPAKLDAVRLYRSQFSVLPESLRRFSPRTWLPMAPHEAVWEFVER
jgi:LmbE family N-acetylglucosaminyl deacetylase